MILAHMGHPWYSDCIALTHNQPNVFCEVSALFYRPWQYYNILIGVQEYTITDKIFFGTDFPFPKVGKSVDGLLNINDQVEGTRLPRVSEETKAGILGSDPFQVWWKGDSPLR
ncbi:MAG: amidohydrolase family protein [Devosia sp.]|nr:amidohydrolase family protein [Devosia sp.]